MKIKDVTHNHSLTDLLKVSIFSLLMLAPMINVGVRSAYVICNKNAYQSYYGETINDRSLITLDNVNQLNNSDTYNLFMVNNGTFTAVSGNLTIYMSNFKDNDNLNLSDTPNNFLYYYNASANSISYQLKKDNTILLANTTQYIGLNFDFTYVSSTSNNLALSDVLQYTKKVEYNNYSYLDNVFEYSVNQLTESPLYNWVENTAIYSGVALMNTQLGITQPVISLLVVYWLLLTIIYVIIDIVIRMFTWLTHMIGSKTA